MVDDALRPVRILLVEDSDIDAELLGGHLAKEHLKVSLERVYRREDYLAALERGGFDLILSDFSLPDFDGLIALDHAQSRRPLIPFIFVSGVVGEEFATNALKRGATDYILKRNLSRVASSVERAIADSRERADRRNAVAALQASEQNLQNALKAGRFGTWTLDLATEHLETSPVCRVNFGRDPDQPFSYADLRAAVHPDDQARMQAAVLDAVAFHTDYDIEYRVVTPSGEVRWVIVRGQANYADGVPLSMSGVSGDITQRKEMEEALRLLNEDLERRVEARTAELVLAQEALRQSQKMEAVGQLTGGIAHDFNNLLTGITGSLDLVRRRLDSGRTDDIDRFMDAAQTSAQRAAALTHRLLAFARRQALHMKAQDVNALVLGMEDMLRRTLGERVALNVDLGQEMWLAATDANQLENALLNLAINARDAMPDGGVLTIASDIAMLDETAAARQNGAVGEYVVVRVTDTGVGMPSETLKKAFDPFFTTKPLGQGTGLGLSMIYGFANQSGGHVTLESTVGVGTTVTIYLPRALENEVQEEAGPAERTVDGDGETVLVVEDDPTVRLLITEVLTELGYHHLEAEDADSALPYLQSKQQSIDLLVTDVGLPGLNGRQLAEIAREHRPDLKVLFVSGYAESAAAREGLFAPGMDMMTKPFDLGALGAKIRGLIGVDQLSG